VVAQQRETDPPRRPTVIGHRYISVRITSLMSRRCSVGAQLSSPHCLPLLGADAPVKDRM
jgi:hypothetical protein